MPTYEFRCSQGHEFERFYRTISAAVSELPCPECGEMATRRMSAGAGLLFKGSGFYLTDYGKNAHRKSGSDAGDGAKKGDAAKSDGARTDAGAGKSESKGDTKKADAPKAEAKPTPAAKPKSE